MSNTQFAFLKKENVPNREQWQNAIDELDFSVSLKLHPELVPLEDAGFSPCEWNGTDEDVGFEIFSGPTNEVFDNPDALREIAGDNDHSISMCWGGSMKDCASAMIAGCALAKSFGAVISYEGEYAYDSLEALSKETAEIIQDALDES